MNSFNTIYLNYIIPIIISASSFLMYIWFKSSNNLKLNVRIMQGEAPENLGQAIRRDIGRAGKEIITPMVSAEQIERGLERIPGSNIEQSIPQPIQRASQFVSDVMPFFPGPQQLISKLNILKSSTKIPSSKPSAPGKSPTAAESACASSAAR